MNRKSILFVEPKIDSDGAGAGERLQEPVGISILAGYLLNKGFNATIISATNDNHKKVNDILLENPDFVGISCFMSDIPEALKLADEIKKQSFKTKIVLGGPGLLTEPAKISEHSSIDFVVKGEGEYAIEDILNEEIKRGTIYHKGRLLINNPQRIDRQRTSCLRTKKMMQGTHRSGLTIPLATNQKYANISTSYGCNHHCKFCQTEKMFPGGITFRDPKNVFEEINYCQETFSTNYMFFTDPVVFGGEEGLRSGHAKKCAELFGQTGMNFYAMARIDMPPEYWDILQEAGVTKIGIGIESFARQLKDGVNMRLETIEAFGMEALKRGIFCRGFLMTGYLGQTISETEIEVEALRNLRGITDIRIAFYCPFGANETARKNFLKTGKSYTDDLSLFNGNNPIFRIEGIDCAEKAMDLRNEMYQSFYNSPFVSEAAQKIIAAQPKASLSYEEFNREILSKINCKIKY